MVVSAVAPGLLARSDEGLAPLTWKTVTTTWESAPVVTALAAAAAVLYLVGVWRVWRDHPVRPWPIARTAAFLAGLGVIVIAIESGIGAYDDVLFSMHMAQHLLLLMVAPPLLLAGRPITLLLHASRNPVHTWVKRVIRSRVADGLTFPVFTVAFYAVAVVGTHLTGFMNLTLTHESVHQAEHVLYLAAGYLYFLPLVGREPIRWRLTLPAQLFIALLAMPIDTFTGVVLTQTNHALFPAYVGRRDWGPSPVGDLHAGGAVMWIGGDGIMLAFILTLFVGVLVGRRQLDAGRWLEAARSRRFAELAGTSGGPTVPTGSTVPTGLIEDDEEAQLEAYNAYLGGLHSGRGRDA